MSTDKQAQARDAERSLLGAILLDNDAITDVAGLAAAHFASSAAGTVFSAMLALAEKSEPIDRVTLKGELTRRGQLVNVGGEDAIDLLDTVVPSHANVAHYARAVLEAATFRGVQSVCWEAAGIARDGTGSAADLLDVTEGKLSALRTEASRNEPVTLADATRETFKLVQRLFEQGEEVTGLPTGLHALDKRTTGFQGGELIILAARPGAGKTAAALTWALNAGIRFRKAGQRRTVAFFSLEMPRSQLVMRALACEARVDLQRIRTGQLLETDWAKLANAAGAMAESCVHIDDTASLGVLELRGKARRIARRAGDAPLGLVVVDYLQLMRGNPEIDSREQQVSEIGWSLKLLARELSVPVVALCQLNRSVEKRAGGKPILSDLRESGALEQHADAVIFVHRPCLLDAKEPPGKAEFIIGKQRNGPVGEIEADYQGQFTRFDNPGSAPGQQHWSERESAA